jgi:thiol:disulfide interchange protein DsbD
VAIYLIFSGAYLIIFSKDGNDKDGFRIFKQVLAILAVIAGTYIGVPEQEQTDYGIAWEKPHTMDALDALLETDKTIMVDFYADWCIPCKEMDSMTFPNKKVVDASKSFLMIKIDLTKASGKFEKAVYSRFKIQGVPTYMFLKPGVQEIKSLRSTGFEKAEAFVRRLKKAQK